MLSEKKKAPKILPTKMDKDSWHARLVLWFWRKSPYTYFDNEGRAFCHHAHLAIVAGIVTALTLPFAAFGLMWHKLAEKYIDGVRRVSEDVVEYYMTVGLGVVTLIAGSLLTYGFATNFIGTITIVGAAALIFGGIVGSIVGLSFLVQVSQDKRRERSYEIEKAVKEAVAAGKSEKEISRIKHGFVMTMYKSFKSKHCPMVTWQDSDKKGETVEVTNHSMN